MCLVANIFLILTWMFAVVFVWKHKNNRGLLILCCYSVAMWLITVSGEKLTEFSIGNLFSAKLDQANEYVNEIEMMKNSISSQKARIDSTYNETIETSVRIFKLEDKTRESELIISKLDSSSTKLFDRIKVIKDNTEDKLNGIDSLIHNAQESIQQLGLLNEFTSTAIMAQNGDRIAFDKICEWCDDKIHPFSKQAVNVWDNVKNSFGIFLFKPTYPIEWEKIGNPESLSYKILVNRYFDKDLNPRFKPAFIEYIWNRDDFSKRDKMEFSLQVLKKDNSLLAMQYAGSYFNREAGLKSSPVLWQEQVKWWEENKDKFE